MELGVNFIDTADSYGPNVSEEIIAEALHPYAKGLVIATKGGFDRPGPNRGLKMEGRSTFGPRAKAACADCGWSASIFISCIASTPKFRRKINSAR